MNHTENAMGPDSITRTVQAPIMPAMRLPVTVIKSAKAEATPSGEMFSYDRPTFILRLELVRPDGREPTDAERFDVLSPSNAAVGDRLTVPSTGAMNIARADAEPVPVDVVSGWQWDRPA